MERICVSTCQHEGQFLRKQVTGKWILVVNSDPADDKAMLSFYRRPESEFAGYIAIEIPSARGLPGHQLVPDNGTIREGRRLVTDRDRDDGHWELRMWRPIWIGNGFHFQLYNTSLYLSITDHVPTLSATPVVWKIQEDVRERLVRARAEKLWQEGGGDAIENWHRAERSCFD